MRRLLAATISLFLAGTAAQGVLARDRDAASAFTTEAFAAHVRFLAGDDLRGRGLGTDGIDRAADYIAEQFAAAGVEPGGEDGGYFQSFQVTLRKEVTDKVRLVVGGRSLEYGKDFAVTHMSSSGTFEGPLAFAGYGISAPEHDYDDYADFDATGKVLLMLRYEPHDDDPDAEFGGQEHSEHAYFRTKIALAREKGAVAVLLVNPPQHHGEKDNVGELAVTESSPSRNFELPFLHVSRKVADRLLKAGGLEPLATLQSKLDGDRRPLSADLADVSAEGDVGLRTVRGTVRNVIGLIRAGGNDADEYVVIGAHYDHLGYRRSAFKRNDETRYIHNGADDNASGTAGLIELGRRLAAESEQLRRSVVLIAFTAEEVGLLGSKHFVEHPAVPMESVVAMLNLDMIGRLREDRLQVFGTETAKEFPDLLERLTRPFGFDLATSGSGIGPSDHTSFYHHEIPVLHFFTGTHRDYHRPTDDAELINAEGGVQVIELVYQVARELTARDGRLTFQATKPERRGGRPGARVRLGVMPSYSDDDKDGMAVDGVSPESPAEKAGVQGGDRIVELGEYPIGDVYDLMHAISRLKPGETIPIVVLRESERLELSITPEAP